MVCEQWKEHAYPLKKITIHLQGTRHSDLLRVIEQLDEVKTKLIEGFINGQEHDDDFGYSFTVERASSESVFGDAGSGISFSRD